MVIIYGRGGGKGGGTEFECKQSEGGKVSMHILRGGQNLSSLKRSLSLKFSPPLAQHLFLDILVISVYFLRTFHFHNIF